MVRYVVLAGLLVSLTGCVAPQAERMRALNDDGYQQFSQGNYRDAREAFEMALVLKPDDPALLFNLGQCYERLGDAGRAEAYYRECLQRDPGHADARQSLVMLQYRAGKAEEANRTIDGWIRANKNHTDALVLDGWRLMQEKAYPQAHSRLQQALLNDPRHPRALIQLGLYHEAMNQPDRALACYHRALDADPSQFEIRQRALALKAKGVKEPQPQ